MKVGIILGSVRSGRLGERVAKWAVASVAAQSGMEAVLLDLADFKLPFFADSREPGQIKGDYAEPEAKRWSEAVAALDGFVIVTPEYNHGYPAILKNALDYLYQEWNDKPVAFVSYSTGMIGGARVVEQLRPVVSHLKLVALQGAVHVGKAQEVLDESGVVQSGPFDQMLDVQLAQLAEWGKRLAGR